MIKRLWVQYDDDNNIIKCIRENHWYDFDSDTRVDYIYSCKGRDDCILVDFEAVQQIIKAYNMKDITKKEDE